jgi:hypothetical protein
VLGNLVFPIGRSQDLPMGLLKCDALFRILNLRIVAA